MCNTLLFLCPWSCSSHHRNQSDWSGMICPCQIPVTFLPFMWSEMTSQWICSITCPGAEVRLTDLSHPVCPFGRWAWCLPCSNHQEPPLTAVTFQGRWLFCSDVSQLPQQAQIYLICSHGWYVLSLLKWSLTLPSFPAGMVSFPQTLPVAFRGWNAWGDTCSVRTEGKTKEMEYLILFHARCHSVPCSIEQRAHIHINLLPIGHISLQ